MGEQDAERRVDALFSIDRNIAGRWKSSIIHWEQQGKRIKNFGERMFHYSSGVYFRYRKPIFSIVLFTDKAVWRKPVEDKFEIRMGKNPVIISHFRLIKLKNYTAEEFMVLAPDNPLVWAYLPFTRYKRKDKFRIIALALKGVLRTARHGIGRATLVSLIEKSVPLSNSELEEFRKILARESQFSEVNMLESIKDVGIEIGYDRGIEQGIEQGIEKGIELGERQATLRNAKALLENGASWELITKVTGMSAREYEMTQKVEPG